MWKKKLKLWLALNPFHLLYCALVMPRHPFSAAREDSDGVDYGTMVRVGTWEGFPLFFATFKWVAGTTSVYVPEGEQPVIMCGRSFLSFPLDEKMAILAHEEGHIVLGHWASSESLRGRQIAREVAADRYAAQKVGVAPNCAALMRLSRAPEEAIRQEVRHRLEALNALT